MGRKAIYPIGAIRNLLYNKIRPAIGSEKIKGTNPHNITPSIIFCLKHFVNINGSPVPPTSVSRP